MNAITQLLGDGAIRAIGWVLLHSLWQGMIIALALAFVLLAMRRQSSNARYLAGLSALGLLMIAVVFTFVKIYSPGSAGQFITDFSEAGIVLQEAGTAMIAADLPAAEQGLWQTLRYFGEYFEVHLPFIVLVWILGVFVLMLRMLGELAYIQHLRYSKGKIVTGKWHDRMQEMAWEMGIQHTVMLKESLRINGPILTGYFKPIILIPFGLMANLSPAQVESVLAHELAHIKRHDYLINIVQSLVETILFFNPAVWWISSLIRTEREHSCDDLAIDVTGDEVTFVKTLAHLEELRLANPNLAMAFNGKGGVLGRIQRILNGKNSLELPLRIFWSTAVLVLFMGMMLVNIQHSTFAKNQLSHVEQMSEDAYAELAAAVELAAAEKEYAEMEEWKEDLPEYEIDMPDYDYEVLENYPDTIPEDLQKLQKELEQLHKDYRNQAIAMEKQMRELQMQKLQKEREVRKLQHEMQTKQLEIQREMQQLENGHMNNEREKELRANEIRQQALEIESQIAQLREEQHLLELNEEEVSQEELVKLEKQILGLSKQQIQKEQEIRRQEIEQEKQMLEIEKQVQGIRNNSQMIERDMEMKAHEIEAAMLELEHRAEEIEAQREILEAEIQMMINDKEQKLHEAMERHEQKRKREE